MLVVVFVVGGGWWVVDSRVGSGVGGAVGCRRSRCSRRCGSNDRSAPATGDGEGTKRERWAEGRRDGGGDHFTERRVYTTPLLANQDVT